MATEILDYRRNDIRTNVLENPYWITSNEFSAVDGDDLACVLFSFSADDYPCGLIQIHSVCCQITEAFAGSGTEALNIGSCTLDTNDDTTGDDSTDVDADEYIPNADLTLGSTGTYFAATGDWITAYLLATWLAPTIIVPANTDVPAVAAYPSSDAAITAVKGRVHMLISEVPLV